MSLLLLFLPHRSITTPVGAGELVAFDLAIRRRQDVESMIVRRDAFTERVTRLVAWPEER